MGVGNYGSVQCPVLRGTGLVGIYSYAFKGDILIDTYQISENDVGVELNYYARNLTKGARQSGLTVYMGRESGYAMTATDGNPDVAMKVTAYCRSGATVTTYERVRALSILTRVRSSTKAQFLNCIYATCEVDSGCEVNDFYVAMFSLKLSGTATGPLYGIWIEDQSQGATAIANTSMIYCHTSYSRGAAREAVLKVEHAAGDTYGFISMFENNVPCTNFLLVAATGDAGVTVGATMVKDPNDDDEAGFLTIVVGSTSYQIPFFATA